MNLRVSSVYGQAHKASRPFDSMPAAIFAEKHSPVPHHSRPAERAPCFARRVYLGAADSNSSFNGPGIGAPAP